MRSAAWTSGLGCRPCHLNMRPVGCPRPREPSGEVPLAPHAQAVMARHRSMPGLLRTGDDGRRDHQNEAMSNNKVAHVASVPAAMKSACGLVGSSSSSDMANSLSRWGFKVRRRRPA